MDTTSDEQNAAGNAVSLSREAGHPRPDDDVDFQRSISAEVNRNLEINHNLQAVIEEIQNSLTIDPLPAEILDPASDMNELDQRMERLQKQLDETTEMIERAWSQSRGRSGQLRAFCYAGIRRAGQAKLEMTRIFRCILQVATCTRLLLHYNQ